MNLTEARKNPKAFTTWIGRNYYRFEVDTFLFGFECKKCRMRFDPDMLASELIMHKQKCNKKR